MKIYYNSGWFFDYNWNLDYTFIKILFLQFRFKNKKYSDDEFNRKMRGIKKIRI